MFPNVPSHKGHIIGWIEEQNIVLYFFFGESNRFDLGDGSDDSDKLTNYRLVGFVYEFAHHLPLSDANILIFIFVLGVKTAVFLYLGFLLQIEYIGEGVADDKIRLINHTADSVQILSKLRNPVGLCFDVVVLLHTDLRNFHEVIADLAVRFLMLAESMILGCL